MCFSSNVHWIYIGGKPFWASEPRTRLGARSRQSAASFPSSCPAVLPFALWHSRALLIGYDKQHSSAQLAGFQLTFQEPSRVLPLCEHTLIKPWFLSEHFINPGSAVCQKKPTHWICRWAFYPASNANVPLPTESPLLHTGMYFLCSFSYSIAWPCSMLGRRQGPSLTDLPFLLFADRFDTERGKILSFHYHVPTGKNTVFSICRAHGKTLDSCKPFL